MHTRGGGEVVRSEKFGNKNVIKYEKGDPLDFLTTQSTPLKRVWPKHQGPTPWISKYCASMNKKNLF
jgi:hypothetical protein